MSIQARRYRVCMPRSPGTTSRSQTTSVPNHSRLSSRYPNLFPGAVIRAPPTPQDQHLGYLGVITQINDITTTSAIYTSPDSTRISAMRSIRALASSRLQWRSPTSTSGRALCYRVRLRSMESARQHSTGVGWSPRWKGTAALAWKQGPLSMNLRGPLHWPVSGLSGFRAEHQ